jgi:hypothetical protein
MCLIAKEINVVAQLMDGIKKTNTKLFIAIKDQQQKNYFNI